MTGGICELACSPAVVTRLRRDHGPRRQDVAPENRQIFKLNVGPFQKD